MPKLAKDSRKIVRAIEREARYLSPDLQGKFKRYAIEIGLVETHLHNLNYGDSDSKNFRQERASVYGSQWAKTGGPLNTAAIVRRLRKEFQQQYDPGEKSYQVAAQVQRPREDLRGRYRQEAGAAAQILKGTGGTFTNGSAKERFPSYRTVPGVDNSAARDQLKRDYFANSHNPDALLQLKAGLDQAQDTPESRVRIRGSQSNRTTGDAAATGSAFVQEITQEANRINSAKVPYLWGGGHQAKQVKRGSRVTPLDCSGAVSRVLGIDPRVSGQFEKWGKPGKGRVTVYSNSTHVLLEINGHLWGTSSTNPGGGAGWIKRKDIPKGYLKNFVARHA